MSFETLYKSVFAIMRMENGQAMVVGTGFVIQTDPIRILTCHHVVSEALAENNSGVMYSITKRTDSFESFDLRNNEISFLRANKIIMKPEYDIAVLEIDAAENEAVSRKLDLENSPALEFDFGDRVIGAPIEWLSTAATGDLTLTPRYFKAHLTTTYTTAQAYRFINRRKEQIEQVMDGISFLEVDKLFIPGASGSPILDSESGRVIGFVHGFKLWPVMTNAETQQAITLKIDGEEKGAELKYAPPLVASLSLGIDMKSVKPFFEEIEIPIE